MDSEANVSLDSNHGSANGKHDSKKQQFTTKQRMDMYAFCVLELELHGNTVSIKKQQRAIQKALKKEQALRGNSTVNQGANSPLSDSKAPESAATTVEQSDQSDTQVGDNQASKTNEGNNHPASVPTNNPNHFDSLSEHQQLDQSSSFAQPTSDVSSPQSHKSVLKEQDDHTESAPSGSNDDSSKEARDAEEKTLLQLKAEFAKIQRCYSDYQKTQVLTSSMLREVQKRFSKHYPDAPCPSRTTIKHVFIKCVENGTVENVKNPRKPTKIPNGSQIEEFLTQEPQMSLREMAKRLNVSTGTVSRRCRTLGIVPESVTLKHQQMALARRQKQMKQVTNRAKNSEKRNNTVSRQQQVASNLDRSHYANGMI